MGLSQAMFSAISGLVNHQRAMDNIGNNLANVNTVAFKKGVFQFRTLLEQTLRGGTTADNQTGRGPINPIQLGLGTQTGSILKDFDQGGLEVTGNQRDMAVDGNGFFVLRQGNSTVYTRDGTFYLGSEGELLGNDGLQVQGIQAENGVINEGGTVGDLTIPIGQTGGARETTQISLTGNLNSDQEVATGLKLANQIDVEVPAGADDFEGYNDYLGDVTTTDATWEVFNTAAATDFFMINGGSVQTTAALAVATGAAPPAAQFQRPPAGLDTDLADLYYLSGNTFVQPFNGVTDGDTVTINFRKGGRRHTADFTYQSAAGFPNEQAWSLRHLMTFLNGGIDEPTDVENLNSIQNDPSRLVGGAMGTVKVTGKVSTQHTMLVDTDDNGTVDATYNGNDAYDVPPETAGAFTRRYANTVDYDEDGIPDGVGVGDSFNVSIVSNLGSENAITDVEVSFNNVKYSDLFNDDIDYAAIQGGSATTNMIVYDSLGNPKTVTKQLSLVERDTNFSTWRWVADSNDDTDAKFQHSSGNITTNLNVGLGTIRFDSEGQFVDGGELSETGGIEITLEGQGVNNPLTVALRQGLASGDRQDLDFSSMTQVASPSDFNLEEQDGTAPGTLDQFTTTADGTIQGIFSNGVVEPLGRLVLAMIPNSNGLISAGNNLFYEGPSSGAAQIDLAAVGGRGFIRAGQLETSNVDLSEEFTKLITTERGFQANARVITTSDEMLVELVNMKR